MYYSKKYLNSNLALSLTKTLTKLLSFSISQSLNLWNGDKNSFLTGPSKVQMT